MSEHESEQPTPDEETETQTPEPEAPADEGAGTDGTDEPKVGRRPDFIEESAEESAEE